MIRNDQAIIYLHGGAENSLHIIINEFVICIASITIRLSTRMDSLSMTFDRPISKNEGVNLNTEI